MVGDRAGGVGWLTDQNPAGAVGEAVPPAVVDVLRESLDGDHAASRVFAQHDHQCWLDLCDGLLSCRDRLEERVGHDPRDDRCAGDGATIQLFGGELCRIYRRHAVGSNPVTSTFDMLFLPYFNARFPESRCICH